MRGNRSIRLLYFVIISQLFILGPVYNFEIIDISNFQKQQDFRSENDMQLLNRFVYFNKSKGIGLDIQASEIVFYEGSVKISFDTVQDVYFLYFWQLTPGKENEAIKIHKSDSFLVPQGKTELQLQFSFPFFSFSGQYEFSIFIFWLDNESNTNELLFIADFDILLLMGPFFSLISILMFFSGLFLVLIQQESIVSAAFLSKSEIRKSYRFRRNRNSRSTNLEKYLEHNAINYKKIQCPDCRKKIIEGSAFCPYCGYHLRKFERFL